jgi:hypothetical protein
MKSAGKEGKERERGGKRMEGKEEEPHAPTTSVTRPIKTVTAPSGRA